MSSSVRLCGGQHGRPSLVESAKLWQNVADYSKGNEDSRDRYQYSLSDDASSREVREKELYQQFYQVIQKERYLERPADCIVVSVGKEQRDYATAIGQRLQNHGLVVEMIHLVSESALPRALQEVKHDSSPFCILVEQSNVALSTCTVILLHESVKIHRHVPLEDSLLLVAEEFRRLFAEREEQEHAGISQRAGALVADFLARECFPRCPVPAGIQHLLFLLREGKHVYVDELSLLIDYLKTRKQKLEGCEMPDPFPSSDHSSFQGRNTPTVRKPPRLPSTLDKKSLLGPRLLMTPVKFPLLGDRPGGSLLPRPGLVNPKGWLPPPLHPAGPSKRPSPLGYSGPKPAKRPLLGEKPGLLVPAPGPQPGSRFQEARDLLSFSAASAARCSQPRT